MLLKHVKVSGQSSPKHTSPIFLPNDSPWQSWFPNHITTINKNNTRLTEGIFPRFDEGSIFQWLGQCVRWYFFYCILRAGSSYCTTVLRFIVQLIEKFFSSSPNKLNSHFNILPMILIKKSSSQRNLNKYYKQLFCNCKPYFPRKMVSHGFLSYWLLVFFNKTLWQVDCWSESKATISDLLQMGGLYIIEIVKLQSFHS